MCTINKSAHMKKKSGNLFNEPCRLVFLCFLMRKRLVSRVLTQEAKKNIRLKKAPSHVYTVL